MLYKEEETMLQKNNKEWGRSFDLIEKYYLFCFKISKTLYENRSVSFYKSLQALYLQRVRETLRIVDVCISMGYPHQAAILCASIWEIAVALNFLDCLIEEEKKVFAIELLQNLEEIQDLTKKSETDLKVFQRKIQLPDILLNTSLMNGQKKTNWKNICKKIKEAKGYEEGEFQAYKDYQRICNIKHSHPENVLQLKKRDEYHDFITSPRSYDNFPTIILYAIKYVLSIQQIIVDQDNSKELEEELTELTQTFNELTLSALNGGISKNC